MTRGNGVNRVMFSSKCLVLHIGIKLGKLVIFQGVCEGNKPLFLESLLRERVIYSYIYSELNCSLITANILHTFIGLTPHNFLKNKTKNNINNNVKKKKKKRFYITLEVQGGIELHKQMDKLWYYHSCSKNFWCRSVPPSRLFEIGCTFYEKIANIGIMSC